MEGWESGNAGFANVIAGAEWFVLVIFLGGLLWSAYLVVSVQGDMLVDDTVRGLNNDAQAAEMFLDLIRKTRRSIVIHDDGNDSQESVYNNDRVMAAFRDGIQKHGIQVRCLFNDAEPIKLLDLAREFPDNVSIWYVEGDRPTPDIHYKVVDGGRLVHLSEHQHRVSERGFVLRDGKWATSGTRRRISRAYREHFDYSLRDAKPHRLDTPLSA